MREELAAESLLKKVIPDGLKVVVKDVAEAEALLHCVLSRAGSEARCRRRTPTAPVAL